LLLLLPLLLCAADHITGSGKIKVSPTGSLLQETH
jgi:hypothetical protein